MADSTLLIADDDEDDYFILKDAFNEIFNHSISAVNDGQQLIDHLNEMYTTGQKFPDLILLDINMPKMDGIKALELIKSTDALKKNVVIMYTTSNDPDQKRKCWQLGAQGFISKASSHIEIRNFVREINTFLEELRSDPLSSFVHKINP